MMKKKLKLLKIFLILVTVFSLTGCFEKKFEIKSTKNLISFTDKDSHRLAIQFINLFNFFPNLLLHQTEQSLTNILPVIMISLTQ